MFQLGMLTSSWRGPMTSLLAVKQSQGNKLKQGYIVWSGVKKKKSADTEKHKRGSGPAFQSEHKSGIVPDR